MLTPTEFTKWLYKKEPIMRPIPPKQNKGKKAKEIKEKIIPDYKTCKRCGAHLPSSEFFFARTSKDGLMANCKSCQRIIKQEFKEKNKAKEVANNAGRKRSNGKEKM